MDNVKTDKYYVNKLINDVEFILKHTDNISSEQFSENEVLQDSMMFRLIQISENVLKLSDNFRNTHDHIPWFAIKGLRNRIVHDYGNVDLTIVYDTLLGDIPKIYQLLKGIQ
ncbi:MAG: DUF86 domain-containing protein [Coriobacteriia bacterium]|nr:DUF86 domain-containing protein [Coriobacteriia bacterium]